MAIFCSVLMRDIEKVRESFYEYSLTYPIPIEGCSMKDSEASDDVKSEVLEPSPALYGTAALSFFSTVIMWRFLSPYAAVLKISFAEMGVIRSAVNLCQNVFQIGWGDYPKNLEGGSSFLLAIW